MRDRENRDLEMNKLSIEEVRARNRELAQMKSLLFYQEQKNHRINKIKSKKYHQVHKKAEERRKEKEREVRLAARLTPAAQRDRPCPLPRAAREGRAEAREGAHVAEAQEHLEGEAAPRATRSG